MSRPNTYEQKRLLHANKLLECYSCDHETRMQILECCASIHGGFSIDVFWQVFDIKVINASRVKKAASYLYEEITTIGIPLPLVLSSLAIEPVPLTEKKKTGAFYTDFRLAKFVADDCSEHLMIDSKVADIAVGTGILLGALAVLYYQKFPDNYNDWISERVFGFDLSENALRGARLTLSSYSSSVEAIKKMCLNWAVCDSLVSNKLSALEFDIIVGNPPWGKVKLSRHSYLNEKGSRHIYGTDYKDYNETDFHQNRRTFLEYSRFLRERYSLIGSGEPDLYMAFLQRANSLLKKGGHLSYIVPAGLIRSQGTEDLRKYLIKRSERLQYYLLDNKARFFEIDSRFKFVIVSKQLIAEPNKPCTSLFFSICSVADESISLGNVIEFSIDELSSIRPDLTIPECRCEQEKDLFFKIFRNGCEWKNSWKASISREVDMTNSKTSFLSVQGDHTIPVIEGRMVQQYRFGAKSYVSGSGRSAKWIPSLSLFQPQYYIEKNSLSQKMRNRIKLVRVGFCDIAGQTNERSMMSAIIPPKFVCGNKVPTILFQCERNSEELLYLWLGITNSFVFDWLLRRVLSTTVNYFLLFSLPMPQIQIESDLAVSIIEKSKLLSKMGTDFYCNERMGLLRAEIDVCVAQSYGLSFEDIELLMRDFPLLDRAQPPVYGETRSTITRDLFMTLAESAYSGNESTFAKRYRDAVFADGLSYIPTEMTVLCDGRERE